MTDIASNERNARGDWRPQAPIALAPINHWPPNTKALTKWFLGFPGFLWPQNTFWLAVTFLTWIYLTPDLIAMKSFELDTRKNLPVFGLM